ncbi:hypothetical protein GGQ74_001916 [Desulfobaculum xiamenense]|uniref:Lipoprotein n=1 Tax=Desulfobaculum xiamenense TaxID=995050 RepID=A0A846QPJ9_9BACT|nr:hypothetical protein [Desulfobaculum xiamenense]NJB68243.1 hypothetical protein [Desulfobaculum xiamenense]
MKRHVAWIAALVVLAAIVTGCSHMSVKHLKRQPWVLEAGQSLPMKFWRFDYAVVPLTDRFGVRGRAYPVTDAVPGWAEWVGDLWLAAYLSDRDGNVIAKDLRVYLPRSLDRAEGVEFEFILRPDKLETRDDLFITFGYRMKLTSERYGDVDKSPGDDTGGEVFFASEGALTRY